MPRFLPFLVGLALVACSAPDSSEAPNPDDPPSHKNAEACDADNGGLTLPEGVCARVVTEGVGPARHIAVSPDGTIYIRLSRAQNGNSMVAVHDTTGDRRADVVERFDTNSGGTGVTVHDGYLYAGTDTQVYRWPLPEGGGAPQGEPEMIVSGFPGHRQHAAKSIAISEDGDLFVNVGAPANACQEEGRTPGSPGIDPCPLLETTGGIWRFDANTPGQRYSPQARYASGIRNSVALAWNPAAGDLFVVQHGRDQLDTLWPQLFNADDNANLPAEEMLHVTEGAEFSWPYCYFDPEAGGHVLAPEYGGNGTDVGRCAPYPDPVATFPAHWAPNGLLFYDLPTPSEARQAGGEAQALPQEYRGGAFVAWHGSWNRAPRPQAGFVVTFSPTDTDGMPTGEYEVFAEGFTGTDGPVASPGDARHRPMGLAQGPDGALYISDSKEGRIWRVVAVD